MNFHFTIIFLLILALLRFNKRLRFSESSPWILPIGFCIKILVGFFFIHIYSQHYGNGVITADSYNFFHDSYELYQVFKSSPVDYFRFFLGFDNPELISKYLANTTQWDAGSSKWFNDSRNIIRLHSIIHFFSFNNIYIHLLVSTFISIIGMKFIVNAIKSHILVSNSIAFFALLLMPNALFWSASIIKEPIIYFSIGLFLYALLGEWTIKKKILLLSISIFCLVAIKPYILVCAIPAIVLFGIFNYVKNKKIAIGLSLALLLGPFLYLLLKPHNIFIEKLTFQQYDFNNIAKGGVYARADTCIFVIHPSSTHHLTIDTKDSLVWLHKEIEGEYILPSNRMIRKDCIIQPNHTPWILYFNGKESGSYIQSTPINNSLAQLIKNIPEALVNVLFRPFPTDPPNSLFKWFSFFDTFLLHGIMIVVLLFYRRKLTKDSQLLVFALLVFALILTLLIGWTTPVIGAIVRYKIPVQLALMLITLIVFQPKKKLNG